MKPGANATGSGPDADPSRSGEPTDAAGQATGLPLLRTWRAVYAFVLISFAVYVVLLIVLERMFP